MSLPRRSLESLLTIPLRALRIAVVTGVSLALSASLATGCASETGEDGADEGVVSADSAITGQVAANAKLVTTTRVNLRETPDYARTDNIITVMPTGASVTVLQSAATAGFYRVKYKTYEGWAFGTYLAEDASGDGPPSGGGGGAGGGGSCYDATVGSKIAAAGRRMDGDSSQGLCYRYVKSHIAAAGIPIRDHIPDAYEASAYRFAVWGKSNPQALARAGFAKASVSIDKAPLGSIIVWRQGQCGYSADHGHIEVAIGGGRACSDFCGRIRRDCGMPDIFIPVQKNCE